MLAVPAQAHMPTTCGDHDEIVDLLSTKYNEWRIFWGRAGEGAVVEVYGEPHRETFTALIRLASGAACLLAAGEEWEAEDLPAHTSD